MGTDRHGERRVPGFPVRHYFDRSSLLLLSVHNVFVLLFRKVPDIGRVSPGFVSVVSGDIDPIYGHPLHSGGSVGWVSSSTERDVSDPVLNEDSLPNRESSSCCLWMGPRSCRRR